jgi:hypothetical protein
MSSIATCYILPESRRAALAEAKRNERTETFKNHLFFKRKVVSGDRHLWEFLDEQCDHCLDFPYSGFVLIDYFYTFVALPEPLQQALNAAAIDDHHTVIDPPLAAGLAGFLESRPPDDAALSRFADEQGQDPREYVEPLRATHGVLIDWFRRVGPSQFAVLHLTF